MKRCAGSNRVSRNATAPTSAGSRSIHCSIRCMVIRVSKRWSRKSLVQNGENRQLLFRAEAAQRSARRRILCGERVAAGAGSDAGLSFFPHFRVGGALDYRRGGGGIPVLDSVCLVLRVDTAGPATRERGGSGAQPGRAPATQERRS